MYHHLLRVSDTSSKINKENNNDNGETTNVLQGRVELEDIWYEKFCNQLDNWNRHQHIQLLYIPNQPFSSKQEKPTPG